jgi:hypothetical protein
MTKPKQTKKAKVRAMLERPDGATLEAICKATGWQAHSARAALSGFRKAGHTVERITPGDGNRTVSWHTSIPRSWSRSSTLRSESGNRTYSITAKRMISGDVLKYRKGLRLDIFKR